LDAVTLYAHVAGVSRSRALASRGEPCALAALARFEGFLRRRAAGLPVAYLVGTKEFFGRAFGVDPRVLIPRPDTEPLVERALEAANFLRAANPRPLDIHDAFTGSGCVGITLAAELPGSNVTLSDASAAALDVARENASRLLGQPLPAFLANLLPDLGAGSSSTERAVTFGPQDLIVANPPYVRSEEARRLLALGWGEPESALDGGVDGLDAYRAFIPLAWEALRPGGVVAVEIGEEQAASVSSIYAASGFEGIETSRDLEGRDRVVLGRKR
jgi:release factor glutamine methyltransferase